MLMLILVREGPTGLKSGHLDYLYDILGAWERERE